MAVSFRDKAANRAQIYRKAIAAKQAEGDLKGGLHEAYRWLMEELAKVRRARPHHAEAIDAEVTESLAKLAEQIPFYKPATKGRSSVVAS
jgi:hypothetical protein